MNVVFFARHFYPHIGGVEKHVLKISKLLVGKGHTVTVVTENFDTNLNDEEIIFGIKIYRIPVKRGEKKKKYEIWSYLRRHTELIKKADVIHVHDVFFWYLPFRFIFPRKKVFVTFHGYEGDRLPTRRAILSHKMAEVLSKGNICVGDYLKKWYGTKPDLVTYGAADKQEKENSNNNKIGTKILYIGRLEKEAGIMDYLKTLKKLKDESIKPELTVVGDGALGNTARQYSKKHNLPAKFKGFVKCTEDYLSDFDSVFTSRYLGTLEALSFRKPVFCIYNNAIKRDCFIMSPFKDYIYHADNTSFLANLYKKSIENPKEVKTKTNKGYNWVKSQTWEKLTDQYLSLWRKR